MKKKGKKQQATRKDSQAIDLLMKLTHKKMSTPAIDISECTTSSQANQEGQGAHEEWYEELSDDHSSAFKEVFDMLDSAHTGLLNADNLYDGLRRVDSDITREEVDNILKVLDKDGNGQIDFDEFLMHITSQGTGKSGGNKRAGYTRRQRLFLTALRKFNFKSNLCELQKGIQPHVLEHYTAGVRLIGLTEKQLSIQFKRMKKAAKNAHSPYAMPSSFVIPSGSSRQIQTVRTTIGVRPSSVKQPDKDNKRKSPKPVKAGENRNLAVPVLDDLNTEKSDEAEVGEDAKSSENLEQDETEPEEISHREETKAKRRTRKRFKRGKNYKCQGWVNPKMVRDKIPLPMFKAEMRRYRLSVADSPFIREKVDEAVGEYHSQLRKTAVSISREHWGKLNVHSIPSKRLVKNFREVYNTYAPHKEHNVIVVCPWVPPALRPVKKFNTEKTSKFKYGFERPFGSS